MAQLSDLVNQRKGLRISLTKHINALETFLQSAELKGIQAKISVLVSLREKLNVMDDKVLSMMTVQELINEECEQSPQYYESYANAIAVLNEAVNEHTPSVMEHRGGVQSKRTLPQIKLPKLNLLRFGGRLTDWISFWDIFEATVHKSDMDAVNKFFYLKGQLDDQAAQLIEGMPMTEAT